jgi:hypothetical protein
VASGPGTHKGPTTVVGSAAVAELTRSVRWAIEPLDEDLVDVAWRSGRPENNDRWRTDA